MESLIVLNLNKLLLFFCSFVSFRFSVLFRDSVNAFSTSPHPLRQYFTNQGEYSGKIPPEKITLFGLFVQLLFHEGSILMKKVEKHKKSRNK